MHTNKKWNTPMIEELDLSKTQHNTRYNEEEDGIKAGDLGVNSPQGYEFDYSVCDCS